MGECYTAPPVAASPAARVIACHIDLRPSPRPARNETRETGGRDGRLEAWCPMCCGKEISISGWQDTDWAEGPMPPEPMSSPIPDFVN